VTAQLSAAKDLNGTAVGPRRWGGQLDWWAKERQEWWGTVRGHDGHQKWIKAVDLRRAESE
jgi:hypothetical protein